MQIEVMSLRGSQWLQLFLEQAQIGQMVEHWCKEHPVACSTYYHWKKALREEFLARMEAEQGHPILLSGGGQPVSGGNGKARK